MRHLCSLFIFLFCLNTVVIQAQPTGKTLALKMDSAFAEFNHVDHPGCAVAIISNGKVIFKKGYGMANLEFGIPVSTQTVFDIASVSKQFTGFAISTLIQEGKISPADDIRKYLPEVPDFGTPITIHHLIHHTSGLRDWPEFLHVAGWRYDDFYSYEDIMNMVKHQKELDFVPGTRYAYSNTGYTLLAALVEKVSGMPFPDWLSTHIFKPLNMNQSRLLSNHVTVVKNMASSYATENDTVYRSPSELSGYGSSSILTNLDDMIVWSEHFNQQIALQNPVFLRMIKEGLTNTGDTVHYGYGIGHDKDGNYSRLLHTGGWSGFRSVLAHYPEAGFSVLILSNSDRLASRLYTQKIADIMLGRTPKPPVRNPGIGKLPTIPTNNPLARQYAGAYQLDSNWYIMVTLESGKLFSHSNGEDRYPMLAKSDSVFWVDAYNNYITFVKSEKGNEYVIKYNNIISHRVPSPFEHETGVVKFEGVYYNDELNTEYRFFIRSGHLCLYHIRFGEKLLYPDPAADTFSNEQGTFRFTTNTEKKISGFTLSGGRIRNVRFTKR